MILINRVEITRSMTVEKRIDPNVVVGRVYSSCEDLHNGLVPGDA